MESEEVPPIPMALVAWLYRAFPNQVAPAETPEFEKNALAGEQRVIERIHTEYNRQQERDDT